MALARQQLQALLDDEQRAMDAPLHSIDGGASVGLIGAAEEEAGPAFAPVDGQQR